MTAQKSESMVLVWRFAELYARELRSERIEPVHVLIALAKCVDVDLTAVVGGKPESRDEVLEELLREVRRVRRIFQEGNVDTKMLRRRLRKAARHGAHEPPEGELLHRSDATRSLFSKAGQFAGLSKGVTYPVHLLLATLSIEDPSADPVLRELGLDKEGLRAIATKEVLPAMAAKRGAADVCPQGPN